MNFGLGRDGVSEPRPFNPPGICRDVYVGFEHPEMDECGQSGNSKGFENLRLHFRSKSSPCLAETRSKNNH